MNKENIVSIIKWHEDTFKDATQEGQVKKFVAERNEYRQSCSRDVMELADMFIVACGIARFNSLVAMAAFAQVNKELGLSNFTTNELEEAINKKMKINRNRKWDFQNGLYQHKN